MKPNIDALKKNFREGRHAQAIAECEALCRQDPGNLEIKRLCATMHALTQSYSRALELLHQIRNPEQENADVLFNIALCERELKNFTGAQQYFKIYTDKFPNSPDGWASLAECKFQLNEFSEGISLADRAIKLDASSLAAWTVRGNCQKSAGQFEDALASYKKANQIQPAVECHFNAGLIFVETGKPAGAIDSFGQAIKLAPKLAKLRVARGDAFNSVGKLQEAVADYKATLTLTPADAETLKKATLCLLESGQGNEALQLCRDILKVHPDNLTAKLGAEWVLSQLVPIWHVPMMNEPERNKAFYDGLASLVTPEKVVFEIGTGSGLLAMMAAKLGAKKVFTCEAVGLIADTARKIVARNNYQGQITVLAKPSHAIQIEQDLPAKADILVHEIFSSELLGEHVLPAIEDAKARLLKPGGEVLPSSASIMIALVSGDELGKNLYVSESFGFDLREFNAIHPKKRPLYREDLAPVLMSDDIEAFRFDFRRDATFPAERKEIKITTTQGGLCYGVIQWIRIELAEGVHFENHPSRRRSVSNWQHTIYGFDAPIHLNEGSVVSINATHDRSRPWFDLAS
ncbi:tetratricopeptide repeat protein [Caenimonas soli]|uniref:tetratricopeptide repeat protein n=1 Tax=Caenimonas soli TaxID=2735555 RepID=UPI0015575DE3|nr:tetratricopeptide repeat protein [Caenimonas soli]NPC58714.1 tetratricopeptide repeat protein [Caenimonas soli]